MKKLLLTIGSVAAVVAPITAVVACSNTDNNKDGGKNSKPTEAGANGKPTISTPAKDVKADKMETISEINPFKNVKEDGLYLWKDHYTGTLWNGGGKPADGGAPSKNEIEEIGEHHGYSWDPTVQLGNNPNSDKEDSIYMVYDNDDTDGITMDNFTSTFFFEDTSVTMIPEVYELNEKVFGDFTAPGPFGKSEYVTFTEDSKNAGHINQYIGSQNNHVSAGHGYSTTDEFKDRLKKYISVYGDTQKDAIKKLLAYWGVKQNEDGEIVEDKTILNHASQGFAPVYYLLPIFTYEKVFDNVLKITYHERDGFQCTAADFRLKQKDGKYKSLGSLSLGASDWSSYWGHNTPKYVGYKGTDVPKDATATA